MLAPLKPSIEACIIHRARRADQEYSQPVAALNPQRRSRGRRGESVARETEPQRIPVGAAWQAGIASELRGYSGSSAN